MIGNKASKRSYVKLRCKLPPVLHRFYSTKAYIHFDPKQKMTDPLSLSASLIAISGLAGAALKTSIKLYGFCKSLEAASDDIEQFALDIRTFASITQMGHTTLSLYYAKEPTSPVLKYFKQLDILDSLAEQSRRARKRISLARRHTESVQSSHKLVTRLKWIYRKKEVKALYPDMESLKSTLILAMAYVNWEVAQKRGDSEETRQEMHVPFAFMEVCTLTQNSAALKLQIQTQLVTIDLLRQSERRRLEADHARTRSMSEFLPLRYNIQDKLVHLGTNIVEHDIVPNPKDYSPSPSTISVNGYPYGPYVPGTSPSHSSSRSSKVKSRRTRNSTTTTASPNISSVATTVESREARPHELRQEHRRIPPRHEPESPNSSSNPSSPHDIIRSEEASSSSTVDGDFISVRATNYLMELSPNRPLESVSGYIDSANGPVSSTAVLDAGLYCNIISLAKVQALGLELETPGDDEEPVWLQFENGERRKCSGKIVIRWTDHTRIRKKSFPVPCLVYEHAVRDLVFGEPFSERRKHYCSAAR
jgi:hypothetical protein